MFSWVCFQCMGTFVTCMKHWNLSLEKKKSVESFKRYDMKLWKVGWKSWMKNVHETMLMWICIKQFIKKSCKNLKIIIIILIFGKNKSWI